MTQGTLSAMPPRWLLLLDRCEQDPALAVVEAFGYVETAAALAQQRHPDQIGESALPSQIVTELAEVSLVPPETVSLFQRVNRLRNTVVHGQWAPSADEARRFVDVARVTAATLSRA